MTLAAAAAPAEEEGGGATGKGAGAGKGAGSGAAASASERSELPPAVEEAGDTTLLPREYTLPRATKVKVPFFAEDDETAASDPYAAAVYMFLYRFDSAGPPPLAEGAPRRAAPVLAERSWP